MFETRIKQLQNLLSEHEVDALLITSSYNISYLTGIFAFSIEEREARILVTRENIYLFTDARYSQMVKENSPFVKLIETSWENPFSECLKQIVKNENLKSIGFEEENISYKEIADLEEKLVNMDFTPTTDIVEEIRQTKDNEEVEKIKIACSLTDKAFEYILSEIEPGITELELKTRLENFIRSEGGQISFESIVAFGKNTAIPHHLSTTYKLPRRGKLGLQPTTCILLDFGAKVDGYCSDFTRTVFIGEPDEKLKKMFNAVKEAQEITVDYIKTHMKEGFETKKAQKLVNSHLKTSGFSDVPHSLGHGVGLQVHEYPSLSMFSEEKLVPGMVITIEPGVYIPGTGGVRIEDTCLITTDGIELLTKSPKELYII